MALYGFKLHYESGYLIEHNWLQISVLGHSDQDIEDMVVAFKLCWKLVVHEYAESQKTYG